MCSSSGKKGVITTSTEGSLAVVVTSILAFSFQNFIFISDHWLLFILYFMHRIVKAQECSLAAPVPSSSM